eukprot:15515797-Heterocapsa_arctica.AAC.1
MVVEIKEGLKQYRSSYRAHRMRRKDRMWDEYDEIWGFEEVPTDWPNYQMHADALQDRHVRGLPTLIEEQDMDDFNERLGRRRESRLMRGINVIADT